MPTTISIHTLPDEDGYLQGFYGLEPCTVRGIVRIEHTSARRRPLLVRHLKISFRYSTLAHFMYRPDTLEMAKRERLWYRDSLVLLGAQNVKNDEDEDDYYDDEEEDIQPETLPAGTKFEIPFEISCPDPPEGFHTAPILPPYYRIINTHNTSQPYDVKTGLELVAELQEYVAPGSSFFSAFYRPRPRVAVVDVEPFPVYDPRLVPRLLFPDKKSWRSAPGCTPCEYDFEISSAVIGPGDEFTFTYRVAVAQDAAREGVRVRCVKFILREHHLVGDTKGFHSRGMVELLRWEQYEAVMPPPASVMQEEKDDDNPWGKAKAPRSESTSEDPPPTNAHVELSEIRSPESKAGLLSQRYGRGGSGGDGLYAEAEAILRLPAQLGRFCPSSPKPLEPPPTHRYDEAPPAVVEVRHVVRVDVEFEGPAEKLAFECGLVLASIGKRDCYKLLDEVTEIVPTLDYDKVVGGETWIPQYTVEDPLIPKPPTYDVAVTAPLKANEDVSKEVVRSASALGGGFDSMNGEGPSGIGSSSRGYLEEGTKFPRSSFRRGGRRGIDPSIFVSRIENIDDGGSSSRASVTEPSTEKTVSGPSGFGTEAEGGSVSKAMTDGVVATSYVESETVFSNTGMNPRAERDTEVGNLGGLPLPKSLEGIGGSRVILVDDGTNDKDEVRTLSSSAAEPSPEAGETRTTSEVEMVSTLHENDTDEAMSTRIAESSASPPTSIPPLAASLSRQSSTYFSHPLEDLINAESDEEEEPTLPIFIKTLGLRHQKSSREMNRSSGAPTAETTTVSLEDSSSIPESSSGQQQLPPQPSSVQSDLPQNQRQTMVNSSSPPHHETDTLTPARSSTSDPLMPFSAAPQSLQGSDNQSSPSHEHPNDDQTRPTTTVRPLESDLQEAINTNIFGGNNTAAGVGLLRELVKELRVMTPANGGAGVGTAGVGSVLGKVMDPGSAVGGGSPAVSEGGYDL